MTEIVTTFWKLTDAGNLAQVGAHIETKVDDVVVTEAGVPPPGAVLITQAEHAQAVTSYMDQWIARETASKAAVDAKNATILAARFSACAKLATLANLSDEETDALLGRIA